MNPSVSRRTVLASAAGLAGCILRPPGDFLGSPAEYDRRWFVMHDGQRLIEDLSKLARANAGEEKLKSLRLRIGAFDAVGREEVSLTDGVSIPLNEFFAGPGLGIAATPFELVQPSPKASFGLDQALGDSLEVTRKSYSEGGNAAIDYVTGRLIRNPALWPEGADVDGLTPATDPKTGLMGYADGSGNFRIPARYKKALTFHGGFGRVSDEHGQFGLIDPKGDLVVPHKYLFLSRTSNGISTFETIDAKGIVNTTNREQRAPGASEVRYDGGEYALVRIKEGLFFSRWVIVTAKDGKFAQLPQGYGHAMPTTHGAIARTGSGQPWRLFDGAGKPIGDRTWRHALQSYRGLVQAAEDNLAGWIDGAGKWIVEPRYTHLGPFEFGWATFQRPGDKETVGMVSIEGKEILQGRLLKACCLGRVIAAVESRSGSKYQFVHYGTNGSKLRESEAVVPIGVK